MKKLKILIAVLLLSFLLTETVLAEEIFENPKYVLEQFTEKMYDREYEVSYGFTKEELPVYQEPDGSGLKGVAEKFTGLVIVSETESYVQVIYHKDEQYDIGWVEKTLYNEAVNLYNGTEKQLLADGIYSMESAKGDRVYYVELIFTGDQQYFIRSIKTEGFLEVSYSENHVVNGLCWNEQNNTDSQYWELVREYDRFYIRNQGADMYLVPRAGKALGLTPILDEIENQFSEEGRKDAYRTATWSFKRVCSKNVDPHRNFLQYDPAWGSEEYGDVDGDYGGRMAAAGCGVVSIVNAVYALNGQFIDPMLLADFAVENRNRVIGYGTDDNIYEAAANEFGQAYDFRFVKRCYDVFEMRDYLKQGCTAVSHVPGHYLAVVDYDEETEEYLVLDSHPVPKRPTTPWGDWFPWQRLESGGIRSSCYFIFEQSN